MNEFGNIPENVLNILLRDVDSREVTIAQLLDENLDEDVLHYKLVMDEDDIASFVCWTDNNVATLIHTPEGVWLSVVNRNY